VEEVIGVWEVREDADGAVGEWLTTKPGGAAGMHTVTRKEMTRPIAVAVTLTVLGEVFYFIVWGLILFPEGETWVKAVWTATCGLGMGGTIGALVSWRVVGRFAARRAGVAAGAICFGVLAYCSFLCVGIGSATGYFGAHTHHALFIWGGLIPAFLSSFFYGWVLFSEGGTNLLDRVGY
jgi:hypothetical protein